MQQQAARTHRFDPGSVGPDGVQWHRVDGLNPKWVRFKWDDTVKKYAQEKRNPERALHGDTCSRSI